MHIRVLAADQNGRIREPHITIGWVPKPEDCDLEFVVEGSTEHNRFASMRSHQENPRVLSPRPTSYEASMKVLNHIDGRARQKQRQRRREARMKKNG